MSRCVRYTLHAKPRESGPNRVERRGERQPLQPMPLEIND